MRTGRTSPNPVREKDKYVDVNFYQLIVMAHIFIKYLLNIQYTMAAEISNIFSIYWKFRNYTWNQTIVNCVHRAWQHRKDEIAFRSLAWWLRQREKKMKRKKRRNTNRKRDRKDEKINKEKKDTHDTKLVSERQYVFPAEARRRAARAAWRMELLIDSIDVGRTSANHQKSWCKTTEGFCFQQKGLH